MKILLVENDKLLSTTLIKVLEANHYMINLATDGQMGLDLATVVKYDLFLIDTDLPRIDGIKLCRELRTQKHLQPILLITSKEQDADVVAGFDAGADDYISKPCVPEILLARIRTLLRRSQISQGGKDSSLKLTWGKLCLDMESGRVTFGAEIIPLTATEYNLLELFLRNPDRIFSRSVILDRLWGFDDVPTDRAINTHIKDIRKKLKAGGLTEEIITTVYGMGYRLKPYLPSTPLDPEQTEENPTSRKMRSSLAQVIERYRGNLVQQVAVLEQAKKALLGGKLETELQQEARQVAHKLAGSMGTFGYPEGSKLARSVEQLLRKETQIDPQEVTYFTELLTRLQQELDKKPVTLITPPTPAIVSHRVLVVDDDLVLTERLKVESEAWGWRIKVAPHPQAARSTLALSLPDVVLLDLSFPETEEDGLTLLREISEISPHVPVIVLTGRDSLADRLAVSRLGARQFVHKPATTQDIFQAVNRVLPTPKTSEAKVLIVDDDPVMLAGLSSLLTPWGIEVTGLTDSQQFWEVLKNTLPDLVLLDLEMPVINGLELCQVLRQDIQWESIPILVVTAHTDAESLQQAFAAGADDFITKPVLGPELVSRVLSRIKRCRPSLK